MSKYMPKSSWIYKNKNGQVVGPVSTEAMYHMYLLGKLPANVSLRRESESSFRSLLDICISEERIPFSPASDDEVSESLSRMLTVFTTIIALCDRAAQREEGHESVSVSQSVAPDHSSEPRRSLDDDVPGNSDTQQETTGHYEAKCRYCKKLFVSKGSMTRHVNYVHKGRQVSCKLCKKQYASPAALFRHVSTVHKHIRYRCRLCGKKYRQKSSLTLHINNVHRQIAHRCGKCKMVFQSAYSLYRHTRHHCENLQSSSDSASA